MLGEVAFCVFIAGVLAIVGFPKQFQVSSLQKAVLQGTYAGAFLTKNLKLVNITTLTT